MKPDKTITALLTQVKSAAESIKTNIYELDDKISALYAERARITDAPLSKDDYLAFMRTHIQLHAKLFSNQLNIHLSKASIGYAAVKALHGSSLSGLRLLDAGSPCNADMSEGAYYYYFEDAIVDGIERATERRKWPEDALPIADRDDRIAAIDSEIATLTIDRDDMANSLIACGVTR